VRIKLEEIPGYDQEKIILKALDVIGARIDESGDEHILMLDENEQKFLLNLMKLDGGLVDPAYLSNGFDAWRTNHGLDTPENGGPMSVDNALIESIRTDIIKDICKQEEHNEYIAGLLNEMQARYGELLAKAETGEYWNEYKDAQDGNLYGQNVPEIYALEKGNPYIQISRYADNLPVKVKEAGFDYGITKLNVNGMSTEEYVNTMGPIWQLNQEYRTLQDELRDAGMAMVVVNAFMLPLSLTATGEAAMAVKAADIAQGVADAGISLAMGDGAGAAYSIALEILPDAFEYIAPSKPVLKSAMNTAEGMADLSRTVNKVIDQGESIQDVTGIGRTVNKISDDADALVAAGDAPVLTDKPRSAINNVTGTGEDAISEASEIIEGTSNTTYKYGIKDVLASEKGGIGGNGFLTPKQMNQFKAMVQEGTDIEFATKDQALNFVKNKFGDFPEEVAGGRSAQGWHFDSHPINGSTDAIEHINLYSKDQGFRVHITWRK
jgi:hypothetical protein